MKKKPVFIAFSTQKGGVGKTTFTVLTASYLHYACGYNLIVVDCRKKTPLYAMYETVIAELELPVLKMAGPNTTRYKKEIMEEGTTLFRSTIFPASRTLLRGSRPKELAEEILSIVKS